MSSKEKKTFFPIANVFCLPLFLWFFFLPLILFGANKNSVRWVLCVCCFFFLRSTDKNKNIFHISHIFLSQRNINHIFISHIFRNKQRTFTYSNHQILTICTEKSNTGLLAFFHVFFFIHFPPLHSWMCYFIHININIYFFVQCSTSSNAWFYLLYNFFFVWYFCKIIWWFSYKWIQEILLHYWQLKNFWWFCAIFNHGLTLFFSIKNCKDKWYMYWGSCVCVFLCMAFEYFFCNHFV